MSPSTNIVVLEDDPLIRPLLERWLGEAGYRVSDSMDGDSKPDLVMANIADPNSAEAEILALQAYAAPILIVSARFRRGLAGSAAAARRLGVQRVLPKPFTRRELLSAVRKALEEAA